MKKTKIKRFYNQEELKNMYRKQLEIDEIISNKYIKTTRDTYITFLKLKIKTKPSLLTNEDREEYFNSFKRIIQSISSVKFRFVNKKLNLEGYNLPFKNKKSIYYDHQCAILENINDFKEHYIEIEENSIDKLDKLISNIASVINNNVYTLEEVSSIDFNYLINNIYNKYNNVEFFDDYVKIEREYISYLVVSDVSANQNYQYWQALTESNNDVLIDINVLGKEKTKSILETSLGEQETKHKGNKRVDQAENQMKLQELNNLTYTIAQGLDQMVKVTFVIEFRANKLDLLEEKINKYIYANKEYFDFSRLTYESKQLFLYYRSLKYNLNMEKTFMLSTFVAGCGFYSNMNLQNNGFIKNYTPDNIFILNRYLFDANLGQNNYNEVLLGPPGSGKSSTVKTLILEDHYLGNKIRVWDYDKEYSLLCRKLDGEIVDFSNDNIYINPFDFIKSISDLDSILTLLNMLYSFNDLENLIISKTLSKEYNKSIKNKNYTFLDLLETLKNNNDEINKEVKLTTIDKLEDIISKYSILTESTNIDMSNNFIVFSLADIKDNNALVNAISYLLIKILNQEMYENRIYIDEYSSIDNAIKELENRIKINNINIPIEYNDIFELEEKLNYLKNLYDSNKSYIRIIMDEAHRIIGQEDIFSFVEKLGREARKYRAGVTLATQSPKEFFENIKGRDMSIFWSLISYKYFLQTKELEDVLFIQEKTGITNSQRDYLSKYALQGGGFLKIGNQSYVFNIDLTDEMKELFDGGK